MRDQFRSARALDAVVIETPRVRCCGTVCEYQLSSFTQGSMFTDRGMFSRVADLTVACQTAADSVAWRPMAKHVETQKSFIIPSR